jgi:hypothetical protein
MISRITIKSGPAKFIKVAMRLIAKLNIRPFSELARQFECRAGSCNPHL